MHLLIFLSVCLLLKGYSCHGSQVTFILLPKDKILDVTKLKAFADHTLHVAKLEISFFDRVESTVGKGENAGY